MHLHPGALTMLQKVHKAWVQRLHVVSEQRLHTVQLAGSCELLAALKIGWKRDVLAKANNRLAYLQYRYTCLCPWIQNNATAGATKPTATNLKF